MATRAKGKYRLLPLPKTYINMSTEQSVQILSKDLKNIISALNEDRMVQQLPKPTNVLAGGGSGYASVWWDDLSDDYRPDVDGARIWRANAANDSSPKFNVNSDKVILVGCLRTTKWVDVEVAAGTYIYWVQWINREGYISGASGGASAVVT